MRVFTAVGDDDELKSSIFGYMTVALTELLGLGGPSFIGPGPSCFLFTTKDNIELGSNEWDVTLCNIKHEAV